MRFRLVIVVSLLLVTFACAVPAKADWFAEFFHGVARDTKRRQCWPKPFNSSARSSVRSPMALMTNNGWRFQNMLGKYYFDEHTNVLTEAGRLKVLWIMTQAPRHRRSVYVYKGNTAEVAAARMESVRQYVAVLIPDGQVPPVFESNTPPLGQPASYIDSVSKKWTESMPDPRLPSASNLGGSD